MIICVCEDVNETTVKQSINSGNDSLELLQNQLQVCIHCQLCKNVIQILLDDIGNDD